MCCCFPVLLHSQEKANGAYLGLDYFSGTIALHNDDILHLITDHPEGVIFSYNQKTFGNEAWEAQYNYPDYGGSVIFQNLRNDNLGKNIGVYGHFNFYALNRKLMIRIGQGLAHTSKPYDRIENPKNIAFGSRILSSTYAMVNYKQDRLFKDIGLQAGITMVHYSNANVKAPNTSINTVAFNLGLTYMLQAKDPEYIAHETSGFTEPIRYNMVFRSGVNQSDVVGSGQYVFYVVSAYADKRLSAKSAVQLGAEVFFSNFLKELIYFRSVAFPEDDITGEEDYKRVGIFAGHELFINKLSVITQLGYYVYYPYDFEGRGYIRIGLKRYFGDTLFGAVTLKSHGAKAEAVEFGIGVRL